MDSGKTPGPQAAVILGATTPEKNLVNQKQIEVTKKKKQVSGVWPPETIDRRMCKGTFAQTKSRQKVALANLQRGEIELRRLASLKLGVKHQTLQRT